MNLNTPSFHHFHHDGLSIAYFDEGDSDAQPVIMSMALRRAQM